MKRTVLLYHDVAPRNFFDSTGFQGPDADIYKLEPDLVRRHFRLIQRCSRAAPTLVDQTDNSESLVLTSDDGGSSSLLYLAPLLEEFGWRGHFLITTDRIGTPGFLDESQVLALHNRGHRIGSHSCSHPLRMAACSRAQLLVEWTNSRKRLEEILNARVVTASIPGGYYSAEVAQAAADSGIEHLFTSEPVVRPWRVDRCTVYGRFSVQQGVSEDTLGSLVRGDASVRLQKYLFWNAKKLAKRIGGEAWLALRLRILAQRASERQSEHAVGKRSGS